MVQKMYYIFIFTFQKYRSNFKKQKNKIIMYQRSFKAQIKYDLILI